MVVSFPRAAFGIKEKLMNKLLIMTSLLGPTVAGAGIDQTAKQSFVIMAKSAEGRLEKHYGLAPVYVFRNRVHVVFELVQNQENFCAYAVETDPQDLPFADRLMEATLFCGHLSEMERYVSVEDWCSTRACSKPAIGVGNLKPSSSTEVHGFDFPGELEVTITLETEKN